MGSATLYHLARRGQRVLGLEQFSAGHGLGSSHGDSRIIREQYFEHPLYVPLVQRSYHLWRELEAQTGRTLMTITGGLMIGRRDGMVVTGTIRSATEHGLPYEVLGPDEMRAQFPAFQVARDLVAVFDPRAGFLNPDACNAAHIDAATSVGAEARFEERVLEWTSDDDGVRVTTSTGQYSARRLLLSAGAWNRGLVRGSNLPLTIERQVLFWLDPDERTVSFDRESFPIFAYEYTPGSITYGFPRLARGVKASVMHGGEIAPRPEAVRRDVLDRDLQALRAALRPVLPDLSEAPVRESGVCLFTNTPDHDFLVDWAPQQVGALNAVSQCRNVLVSSPCSGHGFKFASALGEVQADLLTTGTCAFDISPFRLGRFTG